MRPVMGCGGLLFCQRIKSPAELPGELPGDKRHEYADKNNADNGQYVFVPHVPPRGIRNQPYVAHWRRACHTSFAANYCALMRGDARNLKIQWREIFRS